MKKAFTIVELIVVIGIIALLVSIIVPIIAGHTNTVNVPIQVSPNRYEFSVDAWERDDFSTKLTTFEKIHPELIVTQSSPSDFYDGRPRKYIVIVVPRPTDGSQAIEAR